jgi:hypothetical protein
MEGGQGSTSERACATAAVALRVLLQLSAIGHSVPPRIGCIARQLCWAGLGIRGRRLSATPLFEYISRPEEQKNMHD